MMLLKTLLFVALSGAPDDGLKLSSGVVESADAAPTQASYDVFETLSKQLDEQLAKWRQILSHDVPGYNEVVLKQSVPAIILPKAEESGVNAGAK